MTETELRWVERDPDTKAVTGHFSTRQKGTAEEALPADHPDIVAFRERRPKALAEMRPDLGSRVDALELRVAAMEARERPASEMEGGVYGAC